MYTARKIGIFLKFPTIHTFTSKDLASAIVDVFGHYVTDIKWAPNKDSAYIFFSNPECIFDILNKQPADCTWKTEIHYQHDDISLFTNLKKSDFLSNANFQLKQQFDMFGTVLHIKFSDNGSQIYMHKHSNCVRAIEEVDKIQHYHNKKVFINLHKKSTLQYTNSRRSVSGYVTNPSKTCSQ